MFLTGTCSSSPSIFLYKASKNSEYASLSATAAIVNGPGSTFGSCGELVIKGCAAFSIDGSATFSIEGNSAKIAKLKTLPLHPETC